MAPPRRGMGAPGLRAVAERIDRIGTARKGIELETANFIEAGTGNCLGGKQPLPYRLVTGQVGGFGVGFGQIAMGSGFAIGPQYKRPDLLGGRLTLNRGARVSVNESYMGTLRGVAAASVRGSRLSGFQRGAPGHLGDALLRSGPDSRKTGRSDYRLEDTNVELRPGVRIYKGLAPARSDRTWRSTLAPATLRSLFRPTSSTVRVWPPASTVKPISCGAAALCNLTGATDPVQPDQRR